MKFTIVERINPVTDIKEYCVYDEGTPVSDWTNSLSVAKLDLSKLEAEFEFNKIESELQPESEQEPSLDFKY